MIERCKIPFILQSLELSTADLIKATGISHSHISNIVAGRYAPSYDAAVRIEAYLRAIWEQRGGRTYPPEVASIVQNLLFPPPPGPRRGRKPGTKASSNEVDAADEASQSNDQVAAAVLNVPPPQSRAERGCARNLVQPPIQLAEEFEHSTWITGHSLATVEGAAEAYREYQRRYSWRRSGKGLALAALVSAIAQTPGDLHGKTRSTILRQLRASTGIVRRPSRIGVQDTTLQRNRLVCDLLGPMFWFTKEHAKRGGDYAKLADRTSILRGLLREVATREKLAGIFGGEVPSETSIMRILQASYGDADRELDAEREHIYETLNYRGEYAGSVICYDAFGLKIRCENEWGARGRSTGGHREGWMVRWVYICCDVESQRCLLYSRADRSETNHWSDAMADFTFRLGYAPQYANSDEVAGLFGDGRYLNPDKPIPYRDGVLLNLALGIQGAAHTPKRPTGGSYIESAVRVARSSFRTLDTLRTRERHQNLVGLPDAAREVSWFENEREFMEFLPQLEREINSRVLGRAGRTRDELWSAHAESVAWRESRALAADARQNWLATVRRARVCTISNRTIVGRLDGKSLTAQLAADAPMECKPDNWACLCIPSGLRFGDDPETCRVVIVEPRAGQPRYHTLIASTARNFFGKPIVKPLFGTEIKAQPWSHRDQAGFERDRASAGYAATLKQGTTDEPVSTGLGNFV